MTYAVIDSTWEQLKNCNCAAASDRHVLDSDKYGIQGDHNTATFMLTLEEREVPFK
jgi:hypothetical protein